MFFYSPISAAYPPRFTTLQHSWAALIRFKTLRVIVIKIRRKRRVIKDWPAEIAKGNVLAFYKSTDWDIAREKALHRDKHTCQFFLGKFTDGKHFPSRIEPVRANTVHHIIPVKEEPRLCLELSNLVSLSNEAHEIIEDRHQFQFKKKEPITPERW